MGPHITNFGRTWSFTPAQLARPSTVEDLQALVRTATKLRPVGSRHSWSKGIITDGTLVSLERMAQVQAIDKERLQVRAGGGITLKALSERLDAEGLAVENLGSVDAQTLAGGLCTGTHGSGIGFQCLAAQVDSFEMVDGRGENHRFTRADEEYHALLVGMGCAGIIHTLTLNVVPAFRMHAITDTAPFDEVIDNLERYVLGCDHFKFWWTAPGPDVIVFLHNRTDRPRNDSDLKRFVKDELLSVGVYRLLIAIGKLDRKRFIPPINRFLTKQVGKRFERICASRTGFMTPAPPVHRETEWAFDAADAKRLLGEYRKVLLRDGHTYNFVEEVRFSKGDHFWLSPAYGRDSVWLPMYNMDTDARWEAQRANFEAWARANGGRPHWGKEADLDPAYLAAQYPRWNDFRAMVRKYDPEGKFTNAWNQEICR